MIILAERQLSAHVSPAAGDSQPKLAQVIQPLVFLIGPIYS